MNQDTIKSVGAFEAKTHLSQLLDEVEQGGTIEITRRGRPVARLVSPYESDRADMDAFIHWVKETRATYNVSQSDIKQWKDEGRA
jgi:prevent-host-death family protein